MSDSLETRTKQSARRGSAIQVVSNPLETAVVASSNQLKSLTLTDANPITTAEMQDLIGSLRACRYFYIFSKSLAADYLFQNVHQ